MDSRTSKFQETEDYLAMLPRQQQPMPFNAPRMSAEAVMNGNWPEGVHMRGQEYMQPLTSRNRRVAATPFHPVNRAMPARIDPYGQMAANLSSPFINSQNRKIWRGMGRVGGEMYMEGMGQQQFPEYPAHANQRGYFGNPRDNRIHSTAMPPVGTDRHGFPMDPSFQFMSNSGRMMSSMYGTPGAFVADPMMPSQPRPNPIMRQEVNGYLKNDRPNQVMRQMPRDREGSLKRARELSQLQYHNGTAQWNTQNTNGRIFAPGMPAPYDPIYGEQRPLYPPQDYPRQSQMQGIPPPARNFPATQPEAQQAARMHRMPQQFVQRPMHLRPQIPGSNNVPRNKEEGWLAFRKLILPKYHALDEAFSICSEAYETYGDQAVLHCKDSIHSVLKFVKHISSEKNLNDPTNQWYVLIPKVERKMVALIREANQIKAWLESPQSISTPMEDRGDGVQTNRQLPVPQLNAIKHPSQLRHQRNPSSMAKEAQSPPTSSSSGMEVIVLPDEEIQPTKEYRRQPIPEETDCFQLTRQLRNSPQTTHPVLASSQAMCKKRDLAHPESASVMEKSISPRDIRRRPNPSDNDKIFQVGVNKTPKIRLSVQSDDQQARSSADTNVGNDRALVGTSVEDALLTSAEIDELLQELDVYEEANNLEDSKAALRDLKLGDDDQNYDRQFLEALANEATAKQDTSKTHECITQLTFKHDVPITRAEGVTDVQVIQEENEMDLPGICQEIREECEALWKELNLKDRFVVQSIQKSDAVEIVVEVEGYLNKDGVFDWRRAIKLILGPSYPEDAPVISFAVLPGQKAADYARHVFLTKVLDTELMSISEILRLWFSEICPCYFETTPLQ